VAGFDTIRDQQRPIKVLLRMLESGNIAHAMLFVGIEGIGKSSAATAFAMACNCRVAKAGGTDGDKQAPFGNVACGQCASCRKMLSGTHPDLICLGPSPTMIRIGQIRDLCHDLSLKPREARVRVVIITDAQTMNPEAANALLKVLEEPPANTILILTAPQVSDLLPTVVSRCQRIRFSPLSPETIAELLQDKLKASAQAAAAISAMAGGSIGQAMVMHRSGWLARRQWLLEHIQSLAQASVGAQLALAQRMAAKKEALPEYLTVMLSWFRDLALWRVAPEKILNKDLTRAVRYGSQKVKPSRLLAQIAAVEGARLALAANANPRLTTESLIFSLVAHQRVEGPSAKPV
jgi:DNA polymerase-3 subunit delta'